MTTQIQNMTRGSSKYPNNPEGLPSGSTKTCMQASNENTWNR